MTLAFSTHFPESKPGLERKPTHFIEKIWAGIVNNQMFDFNISHYEEYLDAHQSLFGKDFGYDEMMITPKVHSIRSDEHGRWKEGNDIHPVINNRTPKRFQFAPTIKCQSVEKVEIKWRNKNTGFDDVSVLINDQKIGSHRLGHPIIIQGFDNKLSSLILNDGFDSFEDFFKWFDQDFTGKIIHWTNLKYTE